MQLNTGQTLSFYEILGPLGVGGMGEVYRAKDTRLEREVAIKVLPEELAEDDERLRRFEREAKTLASLNHPNVAGIHGVDQEGDVCFLALELVPGEDLATRLSNGPLPVIEAIDVCRQIAEGLEAAHEAGVVHRDLKPANIRITPDGIVKLLDFGLAKPMHPKARGNSTTTAESDSFLMTEEGLVLGTPTYMSPEQARGKPVDRRTDNWALGCVLFECLVGRRAFAGKSVTDILAAIVSEEPEWEALPPLPARVSELLRRALSKDPRRRLRDAGEARVQLELALAESSGTSGLRIEVEDAQPVPAPRPLAQRPGVWLLAVLTMAIGFGLRMTLEPENSELENDNAQTARSMAVVLAVPDEHVLDLELSPDGSRLAWTQSDGVYIRSLAEFEVNKMDFKGTEAAGERPVSLTWSPDGTQIAFTSQGALWRVSAEGDHVTLVTRGEISLDSHAQLAWARNGQLVYSDGKSLDLLGRSFLVEKTTPLFSAKAETTVHFDGVTVLPNDEILVVRHRKGIGEPDTLSLWRDDELRDVLELPGWNLAGPAYSNGYLVFERRDSKPDSIWAVPFDLEAGESIGDPQPVVEHGKQVSLSEDGSLAYVLPSDPEGYSPVWIDLNGRVTPVGFSSSPMPQMPVMSSDGKQVLLSAPATGGTIWSHDIARGIRRVVGELDYGWIVMPGGAADGRILAMNIIDNTAIKTAFVEEASGELLKHVYEGAILCVSRDGTLGIGTPDSTPTSLNRYELLDLVGDGAPQPLSDRFNGVKPLDISPDNRWMLYSKEVAGRTEIFICSLRGNSPAIRVSSGTAVFAAFDETGQTIYFCSGGRPPIPSAGKFWSVDWQAEQEQKLGEPQMLFQLNDLVFVTDFDIEEGRFLGLRQDVAEGRQILLKTAWTTAQSAR